MLHDLLITTPPGISLAEAAVSYMLQRIQVDADLRWHMLGTEAFARLCAAEADRQGKSKEEVAYIFSTPPAHCQNDKPRVVACREIVQEAVRVCREHLLHASPWGARVVERLDEI